MDEIGPPAATWRQTVAFGLAGPWFSLAVPCILALSLVPGAAVELAPDAALALDIAPENIPAATLLREITLLACGALVATAWYRRLLVGAGRFGVHPLRLIIVLILFVALYYLYWAVEVGFWAAVALIQGEATPDTAWTAGRAWVAFTTRVPFDAGTLDIEAAGIALARYFAFTILTTWTTMIVACEAVGEPAGFVRAWRLTRGRKFALGLAVAVAGLPPALGEMALRADAAASGEAAQVAFDAAADFCLLLWIVNGVFVMALAYARATGQALRA